MLNVLLLVAIWWLYQRLKLMERPLHGPDDEPWVILDVVRVPYGDREFGAEVKRGKADDCATPTKPQRIYERGISTAQIMRMGVGYGAQVSGISSRVRPMTADPDLGGGIDHGNAQVWTRPQSLALTAICSAPLE